LWFGDPHLHSRLSCDLDGELDELYHFARDVAQLDFVAFTDNDCTRYTEPLTPADWTHARRAANYFNDPGRFTAFVAWEYTLHQPPDAADPLNSHRSVIFPDDDGPIYSWWDGRAPTPPHLVALLRGTRVLLHHHHPVGFDITDDSLTSKSARAGTTRWQSCRPSGKRCTGCWLVGYGWGSLAAATTTNVTPGWAGR
jgi:hypothetical protein